MIRGAKNGTSEQIAIRVPHTILAIARQRKADTGLSLARVLLDAIGLGLASRAPAPPNPPASNAEQDG